MTEERKRVHVQNIVVRWDDMDAFGHMNYARYLTYMQESHFAWITGLGHQLVENNQGPVVVTASCNYFKPIVYPAQIMVEVALGIPGRTSFTMHDTLYAANDRAIKYAEAKVVAVWFDHTTGQAVPLPAWMREQAPK